MPQQQSLRLPQLTTTTTASQKGHSSSGPLYSSAKNDNNDDEEEEEEWHPRDPAHTTPQLLAALWHQIAHAGSLVKGVSGGLY